jgi:hypothetical protein
MPALELHYRRNRRYEPHYAKHADIEKVAADVRRQLGLSDRRALTIADVAAIKELNVNGITYDVWLDLDHEVHDEQQNPVLGVFEFTPSSSINAVQVSVSPASSGLSEEVRLSTLAHEMGHAIFDGPALVAHHQNQPLADLMQTGTVRAFRSVTETQTPTHRVDKHLPEHIKFAELRANEFMGSLLVPRDLLWEAVMEEAPKHALEIRYGEDTLFAETLDGEKKIVWSDVTYDMDCWSFTRALAPHFGVNPAFMEVRMMRYGMITSDNKTN